MEGFYEGATAGAAALVWALMLAGCIMIVVSISGLVIVWLIGLILLAFFIDIIIQITRLSGS
jgi:hypothetical protein